MLSDFEWGGGAAISAARLAEGLVARGHSVTRVIQHTYSGDWNWESLPFTPPSGHSKAFRLVRSLLPESGRRVWDTRIAENWLDQAIEKVKPDVINVHNLHGAGWPATLVRVCASSAPTVWTLHDTWSFTGRCAVSSDCRKFVSGCDSSCPTPGEYPVLHPSAIAGEWRRKAEILSGTGDHLVGVAPSSWLFRQAKAG
jgi:hypothetical protein